MLIGILQTDSVLAHLQSRFGDYPQMFMGLLDGECAGGLHYRVIDCQRAEYPAASLCDAYLITGSRASVYDDEAWIVRLADFVRDALDAGRKVVGVCFGHQLLAHFCGGRTEQVGWAVGVHRCEVVHGGPWMQPPLNEFGLLSSHQDQVRELPAGARLLFRTAFCPISGFAMGDQVLTVQGHPEFTKPYARALMEMRRDLLGAGTFQAGLASLDEATHERDVARWLLNFMVDG